MSNAAQLKIRLDEVARKEGMLVGETSKARIYRDRIGGTVAWLPHDGDRLELTLIQVRMADEAEADRLHHLLATCAGRDVDDIPAHQLGLPVADALGCWSTLAQQFLPDYLAAHRTAQARQNPFKGPPVR